MSDTSKTDSAAYSAVSPFLGNSSGIKGFPVMNKKIILLGLTAVCALGVISVSVMLPRGAAQASAPQAKKTVEAMTVTSTSVAQVQWPAVIETSGAVQPWQEAVIGAQVSGLRLAEVRANVGDRVRRGQILARYDAELLKADQARLAASAEQAEANWQRASLLKDTGSMSTQDLLQYQTQAQIAKAQLRSTQLQIEYADVVAPDDGLISSSSATLGAVSSNGQELFRLIRKGRLEWRGEFAAEQLVRIAAGMPVRLRLPSGATVTGKIRQIAPSVDGKTRLGVVYADLDDVSGVRAGMYVAGSVELARTPALTVPGASLVLRDGRSYVFRLGGDGRVQQQLVSTGRRQGNDVEILSGLAAGDRVVARGAGFLNDGDNVHVVSGTKE
jgi:RND family efflux transporter MFP subunit